jgi:hypothetical protein
MYAHAYKESKKQKKRKHISSEERELNLSKEQKEKEEEIDEALLKSGYLILSEYEVSSDNLIDAQTGRYNIYRKSEFYPTKKCAIDAAYNRGYTHYCLKDILVKFRESRSRESTYYSQVKKREEI